MTPETLAKSGSESAHQTALFAWAALNVGKYPALKFMHAIPNGGERNVRVAAKMKAEGVRAGVLDIFLPVPKAGKHGFYIEMKRSDRRNHKNGGLSDEQLEFAKFAYEAGYWVTVCYTWEEARDKIVAYLEG
jgi:hypothetical protein